MTRKPQKIYRFAVYGRAASGKTCIMAALAMKCIAHPSNFTSTWILEPAGFKKPQGEPETWDQQDKASAFHLGKIWLEKAIDRLTQGELPPPNPSRSEPLRYLYHFTTPGHRTYPVELIDYSGELIDPSLSNDDMAKRLRDHLRTMDGILVLAEVNRPEDETSLPLSAELLKLEQAFAILKDEHAHGPTLDIPLALLINKWDRRSPLRYTTPENEYLELQKYLETKPEPPHKRLVDTLRNSVTRENFQIFPVSAFGEHEITRGDDDSIIERPKSVNPLLSFGLEDGFIWAAQRRDTIDVNRFTEQVEEKSAWCFMKNASIVFSLPLIRQGLTLARRFPAKSKDKSKINGALHRYYLTVAANALCLLVIMFMIFSTGEAIRDTFDYRAILAAKSDPRTSQDKLQADEEWLAAYYRSPFYRHAMTRFLVVGSEDAMATLRSFRERREEMQWRPVEEATDRLIKAGLAEKYLQQFGANGKHADRANTIVTEVAQAKKYLANRNYIENIGAVFETARLKGSPSEDELNDLYRRLLTLPHPGAVNPELYDLRRNVQNRIASEKIKLATDQRQEQLQIFRDQYLQAMREGDVVSAVDILNRMPAQAETVEKMDDLAVDFRDRAVNVLSDRVREKSRLKLWGPARNILRDALENRQLVARLEASQLNELQNLQDGLDIAEDRDLYEQVVKYKDEDRVDQYLKYAPLKKMARVVSLYRQHLNRLANPLDLKLVLDNLGWEDGCRSSDLLVTLNGKTFIDKVDISPPRGNIYTQVGDVRFRGKLTDQAKIYGQFTCSAWWSEMKGEANWEGTVASLNGLRLQLNDKDGTVGTVTFTLSGFPREPDLPAWGS